MYDTNLESMIGSKLGKYVVTKYIGSGAFGNVFEARDTKLNKLVALKIPVKTNEKDGTKSLLDEAKVYKKITNGEKLDGERGIAEIKVVKSKVGKFIVMDLLGKSLETTMAECKKIGLKTVIYIAMKMLEILKYIHAQGVIHRDLKPDNIVLGLDNVKTLYCIDFGLAKPYLKRNGKHVDMLDKRKFCGTARYASIAAHKCMEQSRKDDLEALGYILVYFFKGKLPWQSIRHKDKKEKYKLIGEMKASLTEEDICKNMPKEFTVYLKYVRNLDFEEKPPYSAFIRMFEKLYNSRNYKNDKLEWE
jgi:casein kinase 1